MKTMRAITVAVFLAASGAASAADCVLHITRTACPGKDAESFSKCDGKASCDETKPAVSAAQCTAKAKEACANSRLDVTKYKKITASYDGADLDGGQDYCEGHPDYPYVDQDTCTDE